jgi:Family of unknown function (DUF6118)
MIAASHTDDQLDGPDRRSAEFEAVREQLSAIEAALPDYAPSFSALEQHTQQIIAAIGKIAASPSVKLSPAEHASKSALAISEVLGPSLAKLQKVIESVEHGRAELKQLTSTLHIRSMHRPFPWLWLTVALVFGFWLYPLVAATLPGGSRLAALTTGQRDRWAAGSDLMDAANPAAWNAIARASQVLAENHEAFARCVAAVDRTATKQPCSIQVAPTAGQK